MFLNLSRLQKQLIALAADSLFLPMTFLLAIFLRYDTLNAELIYQYRWLILGSPIAAIPVFIKLGLYRAVIRFIDQKIVYVVVSGVTLSTIALAALSAFLHLQSFSRGVFVIYWVSATLYVAASRFLARGYLLRIGRGLGRVRVAIYGGGRGGRQLASALRNGNTHYPVAFIDDDKEMQGATISGIRVFSSDNLVELISRLAVEEILVAIPSASRAEQKKIFERLEHLKVKTKVTPPIESLISGKLRLEDVRELEIEDLLGRDPVEPRPHLMSTCISGKTVIVTGAGGSIGGELCRQIILQQPSRLVLLEISEIGLYSIEQELQSIKNSRGVDTELIPVLGSVTDAEKCKRIMRIFAVDTLYHAAAYKHVPLVEYNAIEGIRVNVFGTLTIAEAALAENVGHFVLVSTDKAVRPTNVMGATKRLAELILQAFSIRQSSTVFSMVRFGNVLDSSGSVVPLFRRQIMEGGPITVTHPDITRYFMTIPEAAQLVLQAGAMSNGGEVFVLNMGEPVKIVDLAKRMVHLSGLEVRSSSTPDGEIDIEYVGLRPGEKLYEELLIGDDVEGTEHPLIMRAKEAEIPWETLNKLLKKLENACDAYDLEEVRLLLKSAVAEYTPHVAIEDVLWRRKAPLLNIIESRGML